MIDPFGLPKPGDEELHEGLLDALYLRFWLLRPNCEREDEPKGAS